MSLKFGLDCLYHFTGNTNDSSGNGNDMTATGTTATADKNSVSSQAYDFNGTTSDYMSLGSYTSSTTMSGSLWFKRDTTAQHDVFITKGGTGTPGTDVHFTFYINGSDFLVLEVGNGSGTKNTVTGTTALTSTSEWYHLAFSFDTSTAKIYVNGVEEGSTSVTVTPDTSSDTLYLGRWATNSSTYNADGDMDEVRIYTRVITRYEVLQLYYGYDTDKNQVGILESGLELLYHFTGNADDSSGNSRNGTVTNASLTTDKNAVSNQAYAFDGTGDLIDCNYSPNHGSDGFAFSIWMKHNDGTANGNEVLFRQAGTDRVQLFINDTSGNPRWNVVGSSTSFDRTLTGYSVGTSWHHFVVIRDGDDFSLYIDGILEDSVTSAVGSVDPTEDIALGNVIAGSGADLDGELDEFRVYSRAITETEVIMLYYGYDINSTSYDTLSSDAQFIYHFTGNANDSSGNGNDGTVTGATLTTDKNAVSNQAYDFDGSSDDIDSGVTITSDFSWSAWFNSDTAGTFQNVMSVIKISDTDYRVVIQKSTGNDITFGYDDNTADNGVVTGSAVSTSTWYHVALTKLNEDWILYLDGVVDGTLTTTSFDMSTIDDTIIVGMYNTGSSHFNGKIDEPRSYTRKLTEDEVIELAYGYDEPTMQADQDPSDGRSVLGYGADL